jgi:prepilin-type N-terminal cleavage/methylation domain-containing protein
VTSRQRFTLVELLVVIAIIAVLAAMLLPALTRARAKSQTSSCLGNMKQILVGVFLYADSGDGFIVPGTVHKDLSVPLYGYSPVGSHHARYSDPPLLGQYAGNPFPVVDYDNTNGRVLNGGNIYVCPATREPDLLSRADFVRVGFNQRLTATVNAADGFSGLNRIVRAKYPERLVTLADCGITRFNPGWASEAYGSPDPNPAGNWSFGLPFSYYNWSMRHDLRSNAGLLDGSALASRDLQSEIQTGNLFGAFQD